MKSKYKAILFDLDNTLINTHPILENYLKRITKKYYKITPREEHKLETDNIEQIKEWMDKHKIKIKISTLIIMLFHFLMTDMKKIKLLKRSEKIVQEYSRKVKLGIITNGPKIYVNKVLRMNKIKKYFDTIQTSSNNKAKPNSQMIIKAAKKLKLKPSECIVIDDGESGIIAGRRVGCTTIYISKERNIISDYYATDLEEVEKILKKII